MILSDWQGALPHFLVQFSETVKGTWKSRILSQISGFRQNERSCWYIEATNNIDGMRGLAHLMLFLIDIGEKRRLLLSERALMHKHPLEKERCSI